MLIENINETNERRKLKIISSHLLKGHIKIHSLRIFFNPFVPMSDLLFVKVILPISNLTFPEELQVELLHRLVPVGHALGSVLSLVADEQMIVKS